MKLMNTKTHATLFILGAVLSLTPAFAFAADPMDSEFHSQVSNKVQQDHAADMKAGAISHGGHSSQGGTGPAAVSTVSAAAGGTSGTLTHPTQVKEAQKKKATPPPVTKPK